jgi:hypothetical protein
MPAKEYTVPKKKNAVVAPAVAANAHVAPPPPPLIRPFTRVIHAQLGLEHDPPPPSPLAKIQTLLGHAREASGALLLAFPSEQPLGLPTFPGEQTAQDGAWLAVTDLTEHLRNAWMYSDGNEGVSHTHIEAISARTASSLAFKCFPQPRQLK